MRRIFVASLAVFIAACGTTPPVRQPPAPAVATPTPGAAQPRAGLIGLTQEELVSRFGRPSFEVREGPGRKLQWTAANCVLDAYLYPQAAFGQPELVTHVDTRLVSGEDSDQAACISAVDSAA